MTIPANQILLSNANVTDDSVLGEALRMKADRGELDGFLDTGDVGVTVASIDPTTMQVLDGNGQPVAGTGATYENMPAGSRFDYTAASTAARPSARTDIFFDWYTTDGAAPANAIKGDKFAGGATP